MHSTNSQGHLLGPGAGSGKYRLNAQKGQVYSSGHHEGLEGKERLDSNMKEDQGESEVGEGGNTQ